MCREIIFVFVFGSFGIREFCVCLTGLKSSSSLGNDSYGSDFGAKTGLKRGLKEIQIKHNRCFQLSEAVE